MSTARQYTRPGAGASLRRSWYLSEMPPVRDAMAVLEQRTRLASIYLRDAIQLDFLRFATQAVEERLRARPRFFARIPEEALPALQRQVLEAAAATTASVEQPLLDLRVFLGATQPRSEADEAAALGHTLDAIAGAVRRVLTAYAFPGDDRPDEDGILGGEVTLAYRPCELVLFGWRWLRRLDEVRNRIVDAGGRPEIDFDLRWLLPELNAWRPRSN